MANYRAVATGNWSSGATWAGGAVPPNGQGHNIYSNNFTVTIDQNVNVNLITNAPITASFVGGGTSAAAGGGFTTSMTGLTVAANISSYDAATVTPLLFTGIAGTTLIINGNVTGYFNYIATNIGAVRSTGGGTLTVNGNVTNSGPNNYNAVGIVATAGFVNINGNISTINANASASSSNNPCAGVIISGSTNLTVNSGTISGGSGGSATGQAGIFASNSSVVTLNNCIVNAGSVSPAVIITGGTVYLNNGILTAVNGVTSISASIVNASGTFVYSPNGTNPIGGARLILGTTPTNAYTQFALNGINANSFVRYYTADNNLGQANPTDVRSGVSYASGNLTGRLTVPARGSVALSVNYGPSMPFTATCSGTTATATLAYSYPLVVGDEFTVTGASNSEWNSTYTIASVVSGTSVTFTVPNTHSATAGTGAVMQTTGTAVLDPAAVASAVWGAATRTITGGTVDTATTLTNSPDVPTEAEIAAAVWAATTREITGGTVTNLTNAPASVTPADIWTYGTREITGGTVDTLVNAPSVPSASDIADEVRLELAPELSNLDAPVSGATAPTASTVATAVRSELSVELARVDQAVSSRLAASEASKLDAVKAKTDLLQTDRLAQCSTVATTGAQLAAALS